MFYERAKVDIAWTKPILVWLDREIMEALIEVLVIPQPPDDRDAAVQAALKLSLEKCRHRRWRDAFESLNPEDRLSAPEAVDLAESILTAALIEAAQAALEGTAEAGFTTVRLVLLKPYRPFSMGESSVEAKEKTA